MHKGKAILYFQMIEVTTREEIESLGLCEEMKIGEGTETFILSFDDLMKIEFSPWSFYFFLTITTQVTITQIVHQYINNIRFHCFLWGTRK